MPIFDIKAAVKRALREAKSYTDAQLAAASGGMTILATANLNTTSSSFSFNPNPQTYQFMPNANPLEFTLASTTRVLVQGWVSGWSSSTSTYLHWEASSDNWATKYLCDPNGSVFSPTMSSLPGLVYGGRGSSPVAAQATTIPLPVFLADFPAGSWKVRLLGRYGSMFVERHSFAVAYKVS